MRSTRRSHAAQERGAVDLQIDRRLRVAVLTAPAALLGSLRLAERDDGIAARGREKRGTRDPPAGEEAHVRRVAEHATPPGTSHHARAGPGAVWRHRVIRIYSTSRALRAASTRRGPRKALQLARCEPAMNLACARARASADLRPRARACPPRPARRVDAPRCDLFGYAPAASAALACAWPSEYELIHAVLRHQIAARVGRRGVREARAGPRARRRTCRRHCKYALDSSRHAGRTTLASYSPCRAAPAPCQRARRSGERGWRSPSWSSCTRRDGRAGNSALRWRGLRLAGARHRGRAHREAGRRAGDPTSVSGGYPWDERHGWLHDPLAQSTPPLHFSELIGFSIL